MPRRARRRKGRRQSRATIAEAAMAASGPPRAIIDSDQSSASLSSAVCDDYFQNFLQEGLQNALPIPDHVEPLDLAAGLVQSPLAADSGSVDRDASCTDGAAMGERRDNTRGMIYAHGDEEVEGKRSEYVMASAEAAADADRMIALSRDLDKDMVDGGGLPKKSLGNSAPGARPELFTQLKFPVQAAEQQAKNVANMSLTESSATATKHLSQSAIVQQAKATSSQLARPNYVATFKRLSPEASASTAPNNVSKGLSPQAKEFVPASASARICLSPTVKEFVPGARNFEPTGRVAVEANEPTRAGTNLKAEEDQTPLENHIPHPALERLSNFDRANWQAVESQAMQAFRYFQIQAKKGASFACTPMAYPKVRLAMHRAAEAIGANSRSQGGGKNRFVVLTWNKNGLFPISEAAVLGAVRGVLSSVFEPESEIPKSKSEERKARRKEKKLQAEAEYLDTVADPELVEKLVNEKDWYALDRLFAGAPVPVLNRMKKKEKQDKKRAREEAHLASRVHRPLVQSVGDGQRRNPRERVESALRAPPLENNNKGYAMLEKMGWREGNGLGSQQEGITQPIRAEILKGRIGLGTQK